MKAVLDTCVLYPTVTRDLLLTAAREGAFQPVWSVKILDEWIRAGARNDHEGEARAEIALASAAWPDALQEVGAFDDLSLPDPDDVHVLALARNTGADAIITANLKDFPVGVLREHGLKAIHPDSVLLDHAEFTRRGGLKERLAFHAANASAAVGEEITIRKLAKRAKLPRLGKYLGGGKS